jgi:ubiquinone/menaquinone biosynthesis C-methylase UbiE
MTDLNYPFESSDHERQRLQRQADILSDITEQVLRRAGIAPGMHILDIGSGAGDVAFLARKLIGEKGSVTGTDRDKNQVEYATRRARSLGFTNVQFVTSDYSELVLDAAVDAVVGRYVLGFANDPVAALARVCRNLRSGGVVAFVENNIQYDAPVLVEPTDGLAAKAATWIIAGLRQAKLQPRLGLRLSGIMKAAGLKPSPELGSMMTVAQGPDGHLFPYLVDLVRSAMPSIIASGAATASEIDIDTLERRLIADAPATGVVGTVSAGVIGVWARKP